MLAAKRQRKSEKIGTGIRLVRQTAVFSTLKTRSREIDFIPQYGNLLSGLTRGIKDIIHYR